MSGQHIIVIRLVFGGPHCLAYIKNYQYFYLYSEIIVELCLNLMVLCNSALHS